MKPPSELFKPGSVGDALANDLAGLFARADARADGWSVEPRRKFSIHDFYEAPYRIRAELAITWMLQPDVREKLGGMK